MDNEQMKEFIAMHLLKEAFFLQSSKHVVDVDAKTISKIITDIELVLA
jgi:hypothetical protein